MKKGVIFDLDGTLLNTLVDIADAVNFILQKHQFPEHRFEDYKRFIGNGIEVLSRKALPQDISEKEFQHYFEEIQHSYKQHQNKRTHPYDGIIDLLENLNRKKIKIAILSNKPHEFVEPTVKQYFPNIKFDMMLGKREGVARKPNPDSVFEILQYLELQAEDCYFVGDTATDMRTGESANMETIGVLWGFRGREELEESHATHIVSDTETLFNFFIADNSE